MSCNCCSKPHKILVSLVFVAFFSVATRRRPVEQFRSDDENFVGLLSNLHKPQPNPSRRSKFFALNLLDTRLFVLRPSSQLQTSRAANIGYKLCPSRSRSSLVQAQSDLASFIAALRADRRTAGGLLGSALLTITSTAAICSPFLESFDPGKKPKEKRVVKFVSSAGREADWVKKGYARDSLVDANYIRDDALAEIQLVQTVSQPSIDPVAVERRALELVEKMETSRGSQFATMGIGRWATPWAGGWQLLWTNDPGLGFMGGPGVNAFDGYELERVGLYIYGPGENGTCSEYVYRKPGTADKRLLYREGNAYNNGFRVMELDFPSPFVKLNVTRNITKSSNDVLVSRKFLSCGSECREKQLEIVNSMTYLSAKFWVIRDFSYKKVAVWERIGFRGVEDRRGAVAEDQLLPPEDPLIRYGSLLFSDNPKAYANWDEQQKKLQKERERLGLPNRGLEKRSQ